MKCPYCDNDFTSEAILKNHQKTAKYCIKLQNNNGTNMSKNFICIDCNKIFTRKYHLDRHSITCSVNNEKKIKIKDEMYEKKIKDNEEIYNKNLMNQEDMYEKKIQKIENMYMKQIQELQNKLENIAVKAISRPTTNTNIMNLAPLDMDDLSDRIRTTIEENMTLDHLLLGQEGIAKLISTCFTNSDGKKTIMCTDTARGIWKSKDKDGNVIKDYKANKIAKVVKPIATMKADQIIELDDDKRQKIYDLKQIRIYRKESSIVNESDIQHMRGLNKDTSAYKMYEERVQKRFDKNHKNDLLEQKLLLEVGDAIIEDDEVPYKLVLGKEDIQQLNKDSTKFSNSLISCL